MRTNPRTSKALAARGVELAFAVPEVIARRTLRASECDLKELHLMSAEKLAALNESWAAMAMQSFWESQRLALSFAWSLWAPWLAAGPRRSASKQLEGAALSIVGAGMAPIHRRALANAKRLRRARR